jgi:hypothetical protein
VGSILTDRYTRPVNARLENWLQPPLKRSGRMLPPLLRNVVPLRLSTQYLMQGTC